VQIDSNPKNATIELDGRLLGERTPTRIDSAQVGKELHLVLTLKDHEPWERTFTLRANETRTIEADLAQVVGTNGASHAERYRLP